jgi:hypothetical protein
MVEILHMIDGVTGCSVAPVSGMKLCCLINRNNILINHQSVAELATIRRQ